HIVIPSIREQRRNVAAGTIGLTRKQRLPARGGLGQGVRVSCLPPVIGRVRADQRTYIRRQCSRHSLKQDRSWAVRCLEQADVCRIPLESTDHFHLGHVHFVGRGKRPQRLLFKRGLPPVQHEGARKTHVLTSRQFA